MARRANSSDPRAQRTRRALLDASIGLARERRVEQISIAQIVERAGTSRQAFYEHFDDRDDAIVGAIGETTGRRLAELMAELEPGARGPRTFTPLLTLLTEERVLYENLHMGPVQDRAMEVARAALWPPCERFAHALLARSGEEPTAAEVADVTRFIAGGALATLTAWVHEEADLGRAAARAEGIWEKLSGVISETRNANAAG